RSQVPASGERSRKGVHMKEVLVASVVAAVYDRRFSSLQGEPAVIDRRYNRRLSLTMMFAILFLCLPAMAQRGGRGAGTPGSAPNEGRGQGGPSLKIERDLEYARPGGQSLTLDLYHLEPLPTPRPLVVWIHGTGTGSTKLA